MVRESRSSSPEIHAPRGASIYLQGVGPRGGASVADEQSRPRSGPRSRSLDRVRRQGKGGARLGFISSNRPSAEDPRKRRNASGSIGQAVDFPTHAEAPRVLIVNAMVVPRWATDEIFWELEARGLTMYRPNDGRAAGSTSARKASCKVPTRRSPRSLESNSVPRISGADGCSRRDSARWEELNRSP